MRTWVARLNSVATFLSILGFVVLEGAAMRLYPGGTWWDSRARGLHFWQTFLCDLERRVALNGAPNPIGSEVALLAMLALALGLAPFWFAAARTIAARGRPRLATAVRWLGAASAAGTVAVALMPSDRFGALHGAAVIVAGPPGLCAAALAVAGLARGGARLSAALGGAMLAVAALDFGLYVSHFLGHTAGTPLVPAAQKVALALLLAWMVVVAGEGGP